MDSAWYQILLIFMFLYHCKSLNVQTNGTTQITTSEDEYETTQETQDTQGERATKSLPNAGNYLIRDEISPLLQYHESFQIKKDSNQNLHILTGALGDNNLKFDNSVRTGKVPDHVHTSQFPNVASNIKHRPNPPSASNIAPSYSAPLLTHSTTQNYHQIQQQFAYKPSNTSSYSQVPTFNQNAGYNDYLNQLSLYHILNNFQQKIQTTTPIPASTTLAVQVTSKPSPPPIDKNDYSNIAYIPAIHGTQLQGLFGVSPPGPAGPPSPPTGVFAVTSPESGLENVLAPGVPDSEITPENAVLNTPGVTSTSIANCLTGKLCSFLLASLIAAGTTGALALPVAWPYLGAMFGRKKRDTAFESPTHKFLNDHNIPKWIIEWYSQINNSDILDDESLIKLLGTSRKTNKLSIPLNLNVYDIFNSTEKVFKYLDLIKENEVPVMDEISSSSENSIHDHSNIEALKVQATLSLPPKMNYRNRLIKNVQKVENMKNKIAHSNDNKDHIPPLDTNYVISKICTVIDGKKVPENVFTNYITHQCSALVQH